MFGINPRPAFRRVAAVAALGLIAALGPVGCSDEDDEGGGGHGGGAMTTYSGTFTGAGGESGSISISVPAAAKRPAGPTALKHDLEVTGTLAPSGSAAIDLTGQFNTHSGSLTLTGGGYTLSGTAADGQVAGSYGGPNGTGSFVALAAGDGADVTPYCGTFSGDASGSWNLVLSSGGAAMGSFTAADGSSGTLIGTFDGTNVLLSVPEDPAVSATGTLDGGVLSGSWENSETDESGSWSSDAGGC